jgi:hypothetical protein
VVNGAYGTYKNGQVLFDEPAALPLESRVLVVFLEKEASQSIRGFFEAYGAWEDSRSADEIIADIRSARIEKADVQL